MFDKFDVFMSWKLFWGPYFLFLALVMDTFSSIFQIIAHLWARDPWSAQDMSTYHNLCSPELHEKK